MSAPIYTPTSRRGWWGGPDRRPRCTKCDKVAFPDMEAAERSAAKIRARGDECMYAYQGKCGNFHVGHDYRRALKLSVEMLRNEPLE